MNQIQIQSTILREVRAMREETRLSLVRIQFDLDETKLHMMSINERLDSIITSSTKNTIRKPPQSMTGRDVNVAFWVHQQIERENSKSTNSKKLLVFDDDLPWDVLNGDAKRCVGALMALHLDPGWESLTWANIYRMQPRNAERVVEAAGRKPEMAVFAQCAYNWGIRAICEQKQKSNRRTANKGKNGQRMMESNQQPFGNRNQEVSRIQQAQIENAGRFGCNVRSDGLQVPDQRNSSKVFTNADRCCRVDTTLSLPPNVFDTNNPGQNPFNDLRTEYRPSFEPVPPISSRLQTDIIQSRQASSPMSLKKDISQHVSAQIRPENNQENTYIPTQPTPQKTSRIVVSTREHSLFANNEDEMESNERRRNESSATNLCNAAIVAASKSLLDNVQPKLSSVRQRISNPTPDPYHNVHPERSFSQSNGLSMSSPAMSKFGIREVHSNENNFLPETTATVSNQVHLERNNPQLSAAPNLNRKLPLRREMSGGISKNRSSLRGREGRRGRFDFKHASRGK